MGLILLILIWNIISLIALSFGGTRVTRIPPAGAQGVPSASPPPFRDRAIGHANGSDANPAPDGAAVLSRGRNYDRFADAFARG
jgi:hypothetical protein